jgi:hypothetical protein
MMSIPLVASFFPERWRQVVDVMLTKKAGDYRIHWLRIVALQELDFNQCNRLIISRPVLNKQLTFEIHRYAKKPITYIENDAVGCYVRIINPLILLFLRILGLTPTLVQSIATTWEQTYHRIKTLYGTSEETYTNHPQHRLYGPGQGSTIGPFLWLLCFILIFMSLPEQTPNITLMSVAKTNRISFVGEAFVDDTGLGTNNFTSENNHKDLILDLQRLAQTWEKLLFSTGGALNLSKCFWFLLSWRWTNGHATLHTELSAPGQVQMTSEGDLETLLTIPRIEPTSSFRTLGVHISPSGSNLGALKILKEVVWEYCTNVRGSHLSRQEALTSYIQYLLPKLRFQPPVLSLAQKDCDQLLSPVLSALLPKLHINRHTARSIIFGPEQLGGLALPNLYVTQSIDRLKLFLGHLRIQDRTGHLIHIDYDIHSVIGRSWNSLPK